MKKIRTRSLFIILLILSFSCLQAQQAVLSTNGNLTGTNGSVSYSVGQVAFQTNESTYGIITEGVQQPFEVLIMEGMEETGITLEWVIFPNPAVDFVHLKIADFKNKELSYRLYTLKGTILQYRMIDRNDLSIPMDDLSPATYILTVSENNKVLKSFKIIKK